MCRAYGAGFQDPGIVRTWGAALRRLRVNSAALLRRIAGEARGRERRGFTGLMCRAYGAGLVGLRTQPLRAGLSLCRAGGAGLEEGGCLGGEGDGRERREKPHPWKG
jgi:hypothetical protein